MNKNTDMLFKVVIALSAVAIIGYLLYTSKASVTKTNNEHFYFGAHEDTESSSEPEQSATPTPTSAPSATSPVPSATLPVNTDDESEEPVGMSEEMDYEMSEHFANPSPTKPNRYPKDCFPKDQLTSSELLPANEATQFAQLVPNNGQNKGNFLTAGYHVGINTVGQTLRNANRGLRSDPPNPQVKVSPWMQTTIEPDTNRKPLEIGGYASCQQ